MKKILFLTSALIMSTMMWAAVETYTFKSFTSSDEVVLSANNFTITLTKGTNNAPAFASEQARIYPGGTLIISSTNNITKIEYNYTINANKKDKVPTVDGAEGSKAAGTWNEATMTWTGSDTEVIFSISGEAGNVGFTSVTVTTNGEGGEGEGGEGGEGEDVVKKTYSMIEAYNYYDYWSEDGENITLYLYDLDSEEYVQLDLIVPNGTGLSGIPAGTYTIDESYEAMSAVPGFYDEEYDEILGCWVFGEGDEDYWDLAEGTVTVQKSGSTYTLTIKATAWDETAFEITYTGEITVEDGKFVDAVENTEANVQSAIKTLRNGQVLIQKNNKVYTVLGQEVK